MDQKDFVSVQTYVDEWTKMVQRTGRVEEGTRETHCGYAVEELVYCLTRKLVFETEVRMGSAVQMYKTLEEARLSLILCDVFWLLYEECEYQDLDQCRSKMVELVLALIQESVMDHQDLVKTGQVEFLCCLQLIGSTDQFVKKVARINTGCHYRQTRYNLLREEPEGFTRLIYFISEEFDGNIDAGLEFVIQIIGTFDLDPNRVVQIILDRVAFWYSHGSGSDHRQLQLIRLVKALVPQPCLEDIVGWMVTVIPQIDVGIYRVVGLLIKEECVSLGCILPYFPEQCRNEMVVGILAVGETDLGIKCLNSGCFGEVSENVKLQLLMTLGQDITENNWNRIPMLLHYIGDGLALDQEILARLLGWIQLFDKQGLGVLIQYVIPSISRSSRIEDTVLKAIWQLVATLRPGERYSIYDEWSRMNDTMLVKEHQQIVGQVKKWMRRISKENAAKVGQQLVQESSPNPMALVVVLFENVMRYENMTEPIVQVLEFMGPLSMDLVGYHFVELLKSRESYPRLKDDGLYFAEWITNLSQFIGMVKIQHQGFIIAMEYIFDRIMDGNILDIVFLEGLLHSPLDQLFQDSTSILKLWIVLAQEQILLLIRTSDVHVRVLGDIMDRIHQVTIRYTNAILAFDPSILDVSPHRYGIVEWLDPNLIKTPDLDFYKIVLPRILVLGQFESEWIKARAGEEFVLRFRRHVQIFFESWTRNETSNFALFLTSIASSGGIQLDIDVDRLIQKCLECPEGEIGYKRNKNLLILLAETFPLYLDGLCMDKLEELCARWLGDPRDDLRVLATRYQGMLLSLHSSQNTIQTALDRSPPNDQDMPKVDAGDQQASPVKRPRTDHYFEEPRPYNVLARDRRGYRELFERPDMSYRGYRSGKEERYESDRYRSRYHYRRR